MGGEKSTDSIIKFIIHSMPEWTFAGCKGQIELNQNGSNFAFLETSASSVIFAFPVM